MNLDYELSSYKTKNGTVGYILNRGTQKLYCPDQEDSFCGSHCPFFLFSNDLSHAVLACRGLGLHCDFSRPSGKEEIN